jgi:hypothetical protein
MKEFFKLDSVRVLTRQEFFNPKIVVVYMSEAEMVKAQYNCGSMWSDDKLQIVGFKFANKTHLQDLLQHREKLPELKQQVWDFYQTPPDNVSKMHRLIEIMRNNGPSQIIDEDDED